MKGNKYECSCQYKLVPMEVSSGWALPVVGRGRGLIQRGGLCALRIIARRLDRPFGRLRGGRGADSAALRLFCVASTVVNALFQFIYLACIARFNNNATRSQNLFSAQTDYYKQLIT